MATSLEEQTKDLTTCSICLETFNGGKLKPKFLPCAHTFCLKCTKVNILLNYTLSCRMFNSITLLLPLLFQTMANRPPPGQLNCPVCSKLCQVPTGGNSGSFPNNLYALHILDLDKDNKKLKSTNKELVKSNSEQAETIKKLRNTLQKGQ